MRPLLLSLIVILAGCQSTSQQVVEAANRAYAIGFADGMDAANHIIAGDSLYADSLLEIGLRIERAEKKGEPIDTGFMFIR